MPSESKTTNRDLATKIAEAIFTDGQGKRAKRLALEYPNQANDYECGWWKAAVVDKVEDILNGKT